MKRRIMAMLLACTMSLTTIFGCLPTLASSSGSELDSYLASITTLKAAIQAAESADEGEYSSTIWSQLQTAVADAKELQRDAGYFAIKADVKSGHMNEGKYVSRVNNSQCFNAVLRNKGYRDTAGAEPTFSNDQIWHLVYTDDTNTTFTLVNKEGYYLMMRKDISHIRIKQNNAANDRPYFTFEDVDAFGSGILKSANEDLADYIVNFTVNTQSTATTAADPNAYSGSDYLRRDLPASITTSKSRCFLEAQEDLNTGLIEEKTESMNTIKSLLAQTLSADIDLDSITTLKAAVEAAAGVDENYYAPDVWEQLQEILVTATDLNRDGGYVAIKADVKSGHMNEGKYVSRVNNSSSTVAVLRTKGYRDTTNAEPSFSNDQIWHLIYADDTLTSFTLVNKEGHYLLMRTDMAHIRVKQNNAANDRPYFTFEDVDASGSGILTSANEDLANYIVNFTVNTQSTTATAADPNAYSGNDYLRRDLPASITTSKSRCFLEVQDELNSTLNAQKAEALNTIKSLLAQKMDAPLTVETAATLTDIIRVAKQADEANYSANNWIELQETLADAEQLDLQQGQFVIQAVVGEENVNYGRYITAAGGVYDTYMTLRYCGKGKTADENTDFTNDQIWVKNNVEGMTGVFTLTNASTGHYLCVKNRAADGYIVSAYEEIPSYGYAYWTVKNDKLYLSDESGIVGFACDFTKKTDHVADTASTPREDNYFMIRNVNSISSTSEVNFGRMANTFNENLDKSKDEMLNRLRNILRRIEGSELGELANLYYDISQNDSYLNYSEDDYQGLMDTMELTLATLNSNLYRIECGEYSAFADADGYVKFSKTADDDMSQLWSRTVVYGATDKDIYYTFVNPLLSTTMYQADEQNPVFADMADFGYYIKHQPYDAFDEEDNSMLFSYTENNNLSPLYNVSALASVVSIAFKATNSDNKLFTDAGDLPEKKVLINQVSDLELLLSIAGECYEQLRAIREKKVPYTETFDKSQIQQILEEAKEICQDTSSYADGTVEELKAAIEQAETLVTLKENVAVAEWNVAGITLKSAIQALTAKAALADVTYKQRLLSAIRLLSAKMEEVDDAGAFLYCEPCITAGKKTVTAGEKVIADSGVTYAGVDEMTKLVQQTTDGMVLEKEYFALFQNLTAVSYMNDEDYQPASWNEMMKVFRRAEKAYDKVAEYTNAQINTLNTELATSISGLVKRATKETLAALLTLFENLQLKEKEFTANTWNVYERYLIAGKELLDNPDAQQLSIDSLINSLVIAAQQLQYKDSDAKFGILPQTTIGYPSNVYDRYNEGYELGTKWGSYDGYNEGYNEAYKLVMEQLKETDADEEEEEFAVQEVSQNIIETTEHTYVAGGIPQNIFYLIIAAGFVLLLGCSLMGIFISKKTLAKSDNNVQINEEETI